MRQIYEGDDFSVVPRTERKTVVFENMREEIAEFTMAMEKEMRKKDKLGYNNHSRDIKYLISKLNEERKEVDEEIRGGNTDNLIHEELLHEGIMLVLIRDSLVKNKYGSMR